MTLEIIVNVKGAVRHDNDADVFVGYCPALCIYSQGDSIEEASEALKSAVTLYLSTCYQRGQLDHALRVAGFSGSLTARLT